MLLKAIAVEADVFYRRADELSADGVAKIDQLIPIVAKAEQIPNRQNSRLKSRPQIFDGSE